MRKEAITIMSEQFLYESGDIDTSLPTDSRYMPAYIAAMIAIEAEHPGSIPNMFRQMALSNWDFIIKSRCSNPTASLQAQEELKEWILDIQNCIDQGTIEQEV
jgi:hypothetical protein